MLAISRLVIAYSIQLFQLRHPRPAVDHGLCSNGSGDARLAVPLVFPGSVHGARGEEAAK